ncbi:MAG: helicase-exonuclease AddAB subunit AddA, partial [Defluviitaleaceae bacterium]|nr:helicase-exonuclease AddAB subunit AddA [Defluviitaleaceae bacterium]
ELRAHFEHVMIDEYQDSNPVQEMILHAIARDSNRFMVGDIKQSIYRFRSADPSIFNEKYNTYDTDDNTANNLRIDLQHNFRSRPKILETVNLVFRQIMSRQSCGIDYDDKAALTPPAPPEPSQGDNPYQCEVLIGIKNSEAASYESDEPSDIDDNSTDEVSQEDLSSATLEAEIVAMRISELVGSNPLQIYDKDLKCHRSATYADITILLRKAKDAAAFSEVFARKNIPLDTGSFGGSAAVPLFDTIEVATLISFLEIIDNPRQDIPLVAVLSSPIYNLSPDELLEIRAIESRADFYDCILSYIDETANDPFLKSSELVDKLRKFLHELNSLRDTAPSSPTGAIIADIFERTDYANLVSAMPIGNVREANLRLFRERAEAFESSRKQGLFHFMRYIADLREREQKIPSAQMADGNTSVRLMSVHKSKGLEFPIVFFCRTSGEFNTDDLKRDLLFDKELFIGAKLIDPTRRTRSNTISHSAILAKIRDESTAEEMRILYVALTRARDKLIITGCLPNEKALLKHELQGLNGNVYIDPATVLAANTMLDWLMMSLSRHKQGSPFRTDSIPNACKYLYGYQADFCVKTFTAQDLAQIEAEQDIAIDTLFRSGRLDHPQHAEQLINNDNSAAIEQALSWSYSFSHTHTPSKLSISEIKRLYQAQMQDSYATVYSAETYSYRKPNFLEQRKGFSPAETGTIIHTVMEHLDLHAAHEEAHVHTLLEQLTARNILTAEEAKAVPVKLIVGFVKSPLAMRMRAASELRKEVPFVLALNASEIYRDIDFHEHARPILVHGIIDAYFIENGEVIIVDYKSDFVSPSDTPEQIQAKYMVQLEIYRKAIERTINMPVKECILYMLRANTEIFVG